MSRVFGRFAGRELPSGFPAKLVDDERVVGVATLAEGGHVVATTLGLWLAQDADPGAVRRIGWHLISKATWENNRLTVIEAEETGTVEGAVLLADRPPRRLRLEEAGGVPEAVHARVTGSIKSSHHRDLPGGGAWVVQRSVAGRDGILLQVRADPGTDAAAVRSLATQIADQVRRIRTGE
jgi:hypothetical protein